MIGDARRHIERAAVDDFDAIAALLEASHLPLDGLREHLATALVARQNGTIVGSAALEVYPDGALLRSVAVSPGQQGSGLGHALTSAAIRMAEDLRIPAMYLLTTTADQYFSKFDFERIERTDVPPSVQASVEFASACPSSAVVMRKRLTTR
jgi:amino-acid N-acetyltransferase